MDGLKELRLAYGFRKVIVGAEAEAQTLLVKTGSDNHGNVARGRVSLQTIEDFPTVVTRQHYVEDYSLWRGRGCEAQRLASVGGMDNSITGLRQVIVQQRDVGWVDCDAEELGVFLVLGQRFP